MLTILLHGRRLDVRLLGKHVDFAMSAACPLSLRQRPESVTRGIIGNSTPGM